jgi:hypothetical protein
MLNRRMLQLVCFALCLFASTLASAATRPWLSGSIGGSTYTMKDVNDEVALINESLAGSGLEMDEVTKGLNYGLAFGLDVGTGGFSVGIGYDRLTGSTEVSDPTGSIEYDLPSNVFRGFGRYSFQSTGKTKGFLEASLGRVISDGTGTVSATGIGSGSVDFEGSGLAAEGAGGFSYWTSPKLALVGTLGYRFAKVEDVEADGEPLYSPEGNGRYSIDYTGVFIRLGLTVALAP